MQSFGSAYRYNAMARAISGLAGGALGALFGSEGGPEVLYAGGGLSLETRRLLKAGVIDAGAGEGGAFRAFKEDSEGKTAMIWS